MLYTNDGLRANDTTKLLIKLRMIRAARMNRIRQLFRLFVDCFRGTNWGRLHISHANLAKSIQTVKTRTRNAV